MNFAVVLLERKRKMFGLHQFTVLVVICYLFGSASSRRCGDGWVERYGRCYHFSRFSTHFFAAMYYCKRIGGALVEIDGSHEYLTVTNLAKAIYFPDFFIGLTDIYSKGVWLKAKSLDFQRYFKWSPGEPSYGDQDCVQVYRFDSKMDNVRCTKNRHFVCEK